jgi:hypothetical protein
MDRAMTHNHTTNALCPHLAAAVLWTSKRPRLRRNGKHRVYYARSLGGSAMDDFVAL